MTISLPASAAEVFKRGTIGDIKLRPAVQCLHQAQLVLTRLVTLQEM
jgi:hypothetical protein